MLAWPMLRPEDLSSFYVYHQDLEMSDLPQRSQRIPPRPINFTISQKVNPRTHFSQRSFVYERWEDLPENRQ